MPESRDNSCSDSITDSVLRNSLFYSPLNLKLTGSADPILARTGASPVTRQSRFHLYQIRPHSSTAQSSNEPGPRLKHANCSWTSPKQTPIGVAPVDSWSPQRPPLSTSQIPFSGADDMHSMPPRFALRIWIPSDLPGPGRILSVVLPGLDPVQLGAESSTRRFPDWR